MPIYEYHHPVTGECIEARRSLAERDQPPAPDFIRRTVPSRVSPIATRPAPPSMRDGVLRGYYQQEQRDGSRFRSAFTKDRIKAAWN